MVTKHNYQVESWCMPGRQTLLHHSYPNPPAGCTLKLFTPWRLEAQH